MTPHWYQFDIYECPVCGGGETIRTRMYTPKPRDMADRYTFHQSYDWCNEYGGLY